MRYLFLSLIAFSYLVSKTDTCIEHISFYAQKDVCSNEMLKRNGILTRNPDAKATILILHGFGGDKQEVGPLRLMLRKFNVISFDFRAHGEHKCEQLSTIGHDEVYDVFGVVNWIKNDPELGKLPIIAFGLSMGAVAAIEAQSKDPDLFIAMFLDTPFTTSDSIIESLTSNIKLFGYDIEFLKRLIRQYAFTPIGQSIIKSFLKLKYGELIKVDTYMKPIYPIESIKQITIPICLIVCKNDDKVPYKEVIKLVDAHPGRTRLIVTGGRQHCDSIFHMPEEYKNLLNDFINAVLSGEINNQPQKEFLEYYVEDDDVIRSEDLDQELQVTEIAEDFT